jgi:hypothetical protein
VIAIQRPSKFDRTRRTITAQQATARPHTAPRAPPLIQSLDPLLELADRGDGIFALAIDIEAIAKPIKLSIQVDREHVCDGDIVYIADAPPRLVFGRYLVPQFCFRGCSLASSRHSARDAASTAQGAQNATTSHEARASQRLSATRPARSSHRPQRYLPRALDCLSAATRRGRPPAQLRHLTKLDHIKVRSGSRRSTYSASSVKADTRLRRRSGHICPKRRTYIYLDNPRSLRVILVERK